MNTPAGWNPDPFDPTIDRYWDGQQWTAQTRPKIVDAPTQVFGAPGSPQQDPTAPDDQKRRKWPWIAGVAAAGVAVIGIAAGTGGSEESKTPAATSSTTVAATTTQATTTTTVKTTTSAAAPTTTTTVAPTTTTTLAMVPLVPQVTTTTQYVPPPPVYTPPKTTEPAYVPPPVKVPNAGVKYANCDEAKAAGAAPILRGEPGYAPKLDRDNDGIACDK
ncbi:excalibur calcium-binding domain-containing protein [Rhodococcus globerulus]|uniref:Excalibur calcium-binding domain-containing protein n=1 Tax=Rhodococcus globerulus TaxID=33008 RepID=A0ABU4BS03_RHOGO|nr:excalibur calcium-binding domain-containing protein [Rhodococcus globerulus]MDV6266995.1 excalibur calcium-binding domain-containing protein [Rhodococcus globerulus]